MTQRKMCVVVKIGAYEDCFVAVYVWGKVTDLCKHIAESLHVP